MNILGIETSCDETAVAVISVARTKKINVLSNIISSQIPIHAKYGGVVPEVAARHHTENFMGVFHAALKEARLSADDIDMIACVSGPGLVTSLFVGAAAGKTLSYMLQKPLVPVNHMKAHIYANFIETPHIPLPALCLLVSGGHTELVLMQGEEKFRRIGATVDDAAGEAFDKIAKMLGLPYPGGPQISKYAEKGNPKAYSFPRPMFSQKNNNFSFAGLKTSVLYFLKGRNLLAPKQSIGAEILADICASAQQAILDCLIGKTIRAVKKCRVKSVLLAGGVAANTELRKQLCKALCNEFSRLPFYPPDLQYCTDNAAMVAVAGYFQYKHAKDKGKLLHTWKNMKVDPNLDI